MTNATDFARGSKGLDGEDRIARMLQMFSTLQGLGVEVRVLSTSWGLIQSQDWAEFILEFLKLVYLLSLIPEDKRENERAFFLSLPLLYSLYVCSIPQCDIGRSRGCVQPGPHHFPG